MINQLANPKPAVRRRARTRRGIAAVEAAILLPFLVLMMLAVVEYGRAVMVEQLLDNACREGARRAVLNGATATDVTSSVTNYLGNMGITGATVSVTPSTLSSMANGQQVKVSATLNFSNVSWSTPIYATNLVLSAECVMRRDTQQW